MKLLFQHIPKTGGTTVHHVLQNEIGGRIHDLRTHGFFDIPLEELEGYDMFSAHMFKPDVDHLRRLGDVLSITMFRSPVERALSEYNYLKAQAALVKEPGAVPVFKKILEATPTEFFQDMLDQTFDNKLFRTVGGYSKIHESEVGRVIQFYETFDVVGISLYLDEFLDVVFRKLGQTRGFKPIFMNTTDSLLKKESWRTKTGKDLPGGCFRRNMDRALLGGSVDLRSLSGEVRGGASSRNFQVQAALCARAVQVQAALCARAVNAYDTRCRPGNNLVSSAIRVSETSIASG